VDNQIFKTIQPKKELGQNFLQNKEVLSNIIKLGELKEDDIVIEIGPGRGNLTQELIKSAKKVIAIEKDRDLVQLLREKFSSVKNLKIIEGDIRDLFIKNQLSIVKDSEHYKLIANIPYYLSSFILRRFLEINNKPKKIVLLLQKELAERICEKPGKMSLISIMVNFYGIPSLGPIVKKEKFDPVPKVDSQILVIDNIKSPKNIDEKTFFRILRIGFAQKRKKLINNLHNGTRIDNNILLNAIKFLKLKETVRAQELSLGNWKSLCQKIRKIMS